MKPSKLAWLAAKVEQQWRSGFNNREIRFQNREKRVREMSNYGGWNDYSQWRYESTIVACYKKQFSHTIIQHKCLTPLMCLTLNIGKACQGNVKLWNWVIIVNGDTNQP